MATRAEDFGMDASIEVVNAGTDTSPVALEAWVAELERDDDWIDLPLSAADLIAEDRAALGL